MPSEYSPVWPVCLSLFAMWIVLRFLSAIWYLRTSHEHVYFPTSWLRQDSAGQRTVGSATHHQQVWFPPAASGFINTLWIQLTSELHQLFEAYQIYSRLMLSVTQIRFSHTQNWSSSLARLSNNYVSYFKIWCRVWNSFTVKTAAVTYN